MADGTRKLPVLSMAIAVYRFVFAHLPTFGRLAVRPMVILFGFSFITATYFTDAVLSMAGSIADYAVFILFLTPFLVAWHRLVLLGPEAIAGHRGLAFERRDRIFFLWSILLAILIELFLQFLVALPTDFIGESFDFTKFGMAGGFILTFVAELVLFPMIVLVSRFILVFPSIAIDAGALLGEVWQLTRGNALRLALLYYLVYIPISVALAMVHLAVLHVSTWLAAQGYGVNWAVAMYIIEKTIWSFFIGALLATGLSLSYRLLTAPREEGEDERESTP
jgi:hypothetical protein